MTCNIVNEAYEGTGERHSYQADMHRRM